jgi:CRISPR-associated endonuclease Cas1
VQKLIKYNKKAGLPPVTSSRQALTTTGEVTPMAATQTVPQYRQDRNFTPIIPQHGVITLFGYSIKACVDRGHLILEDGIGPERRHARLPRIGHGLRRLVVIGSDGMVTLGALRWLADQDASFVMLNRDGSVLAVTGPVRPSDARLRRAQALAHHTGAALQIARELIGRKLDAQEELARDGLNNCGAAETIGSFRKAIPSAETIEAIRLIESRGAYAYWGAWNNLPINFPRTDLRRVPDHWRVFRNRVSPLTGSPRLAANAVNAMLNYLYAVLESESRLAVAALGLDPGLGVMHMDAPARDSLAFDVMEPVRPMVDEYVLSWITRETLKREWFFEQRDGSCRLMGSFAVRLSETAPTWGNAVAPVAEWLARILWSTTTRGIRQQRPATRLTQDHRREARGLPAISRSTPPPRPDSFCKDCGAGIGRGSTYCAACAIKHNADRLIKVARTGRVAAQSDQAQQWRAETQRRHAAARAGWRTSDLPVWLNEEVYLSEIQPQLKSVALSALASTLSISIPYAVQIRSGQRVPHPRHWKMLAGLAGISRKD